MQHEKMKEKIKGERYRQIRAILHTELNAKNKLEAINTLAIPVVTQCQCYQLELRRNKADGQKDAKYTDLEQDAPPKSRC